MTVKICYGCKSFEICYDHNQTSRDIGYEKLNLLNRVNALVIGYNEELGEVLYSDSRAKVTNSSASTERMRSGQNLIETS